MKLSQHPPQLEGGKILEANHLEELKQSAISEQIARLNFESLGGQSAVEVIAGEALSQVGGHGQQYATGEVRRTLDRYSNLTEGGWYCHGLDPLNSWQSMGWGCFKPDHPRKDPVRDRTIKYEHPARTATRTFFLRTEDPEFWPSLAEDKDTPLVIVEGAKKAACLLSHGIAAVAVPGVNNLTVKAASYGFQLHPDLKEIVEGRQVLLAFDQDHSPDTRRKVAAAIRRGSQCLARVGAEVSIVTWDPNLGKGPDDLVVEHGIEQFNQALNTAKHYDPREKLVLRAGEIAIAEEQAIAFLGGIENDRNRIYTQGNSQGYRLVRILKAEADISSRYLEVKKDNDVIDLLTPEGLQHKINREFRLYREVWNKKQEAFTEQKIDCPLSFCKQILAAGRYPKVLRLRGLCYHPLLTKTGGVVAVPGYHKGTGYLLQFDKPEYQLKQRPTKQNAQEALALLKDLLKEFCFKSKVDGSAAIALILTTVSRRLYALAPMICVKCSPAGDRERDTYRPRRNPRNRKPRRGGNKLHGRRGRDAQEGCFNIVDRHTNRQYR